MRRRNCPWPAKMQPFDFDIRTPALVASSTLAIRELGSCVRHTEPDRAGAGLAAVERGSCTVTVHRVSVDSPRSASRQRGPGERHRSVGPQLGRLLCFLGPELRAFDNLLAPTKLGVRRLSERPDLRAEPLRRDRSHRPIAPQAEQGPSHNCPPSGTAHARRPASAEPLRGLSHICWPGGRPSRRSARYARTVGYSDGAACASRPHPPPGIPVRGCRKTARRTTSSTGRPTTRRTMTHRGRAVVLPAIPPPRHRLDARD